MFEEDENLVLEDTENVEETTEELTDGAKEAETEENIESGVATEEAQKTYTEEELNKRVDELLAQKLGKKLSAREAKIRREYDKKYSAYKELGTVVNTGLGVDDVTEATKSLREFYTNKGIAIPNNTPSYSEDDMKVLANAEAQTIIDSGLDDVIEEVDRLADIGVSNMTPREKLVFTKLAEYRRTEGNRKELSSIGVKADILESKDFKEFAKDYKPDTPITKIYENYSKATDNKNIEKIGSMKNGNSKEEKDYYTSEEVDKLTEKDLEDPKIFDKVRRSMAKWK